MPEPNDTHSKGNIVMVTDGASIPDPREWRLINAWSIALVGAVCALFALCLLWPDPYLRILLYLPDGVVVTFKITVMSICCAVPLGLLTGLGRISRNRAINLLASTYVEVIRGIPLLVQLFYIYYALSRFFQISGITSAVIAISVCYGAYMGEVFRAGIMAISKGQSEAARSLGFNRFQTMFYVVLPQGLAHHSAARGQRVHRHAQGHLPGFDHGRARHHAARPQLCGHHLSVLRDIHGYCPDLSDHHPCALQSREHHGIQTELL